MEKFHFDFNHLDLDQDFVERMKNTTKRLSQVVIPTQEIKLSARKRRKTEQIQFQFPNAKQNIGSQDSAFKPVQSSRRKGGKQQ
mmetsp:Transcript_30351/g.42615  ORF Transcript_30351/g.42615 Transcript_30351/m.42615 type:complete len:84 (-) Transcript_30351:219-470(-)